MAKFRALINGLKAFTCSTSLNPSLGSQYLKPAAEMSGVEQGFQGSFVLQRRVWIRENFLQQLASVLYKKDLLANPFDVRKAMAFERAFNPVPSDVMCDVALARIV